MDNVKTIENDKSNKLKLILIIIFIVIPLLIVTLFYFNNKTFKSRVNNLLGKLPGLLVNILELLLQKKREWR